MLNRQRLVRTITYLLFGLYWGYMEIMEMEKKMDTTTMGYMGFRVQGV